MRGERAMLDPEGIPGRPWYRHQIYAPKYTYAPELLPALNEAIDSGDAAKVTEAVTRIAARAESVSDTDSRQGVLCNNVSTPTRRR